MMKIDRESFASGVVGFALTAIAVMIIVMLFRAAYINGYEDGRDCAKYSVRCR